MTPVEELGTLAQECEMWAAQPEMSVRDRHDLITRANAYRQEQLKLLQATYTFENLLDPEPNTSELPPEYSRGAAWGVKYALIGEAIIGAVLTVGYVVWSHLSAH